MDKDKFKKIRRLIDWLGIVVSAAMVFYVDSIALKVILGATAIISLGFVLFKVDDRLERFIYNRSVKKVR